MEQRLAERCASEVAQIFHLPYRRIVFGKPFDLAGRVGTSSAPQITNLRYGRVQLCATPAGRWRRCSVGTSARGLFAKRGLRILLPPSHLLAMRSRRCASEVAQIFHLPYRRMVFGEPFDLAGRVGTSSAPQITNLRYGRVQLCATPAGRWRRCSVGTSARGLFAKRGLRILLPPSHLLAMRSRRCASEVAQIFHLPYRRMVFGEPFDLAGRVGTSSAPQITNLRYGRVQLCATPAGRWRRCSVGTSARGLFAKRGLRILLPPSHLLAMRSRRCASEVAQIFHLPYRRMVFGEPFDLAGRVGTSSAPQITNLRYGRVQLCATPAGRWRRCSVGTSARGLFAKRGLRILLPPSHLLAMRSRRCASEVAQIFHLPYRRMVFGEPFDLAGRVGTSSAPQITNLRYGRVQLCATPAGRWRRCSVGTSARGLFAKRGLRILLPPSHLLAMRSRRCASEVAQIFHLPYRRMVFGEPFDLAGRVGTSSAPQITNLRYGRVQLCATPAGRWRRCSVGTSARGLFA